MSNDALQNVIEFQLHYYLKDEDIHYMDATIHNECERYLLSSIKLLQKYLDDQITIEVLAKEEGGLKDIYKLLFDPKLFPFITLLLGAYLDSCFRPQIHKTEEIKNKIEIINNLKEGKYDNDEINYLVQGDKELEKLKSKYYKKADSNISITKIEAQLKFPDNSTQRQEINKIDFSTHIKEEVTVKSKEELFGVTLYIVSPILINTNKSNWKGIYNQKPIEFRMNDKDFLRQVYNHEVKFGTGTALKCTLEIYKELDFDGNEGIKYIVKDVTEWIDDDSFQYYSKKYKRIKEGHKQLTINFE